MKKKTLVIGGSTKPERYSNKAIRKLLVYGHPVKSIGLRKSKVETVDIITGKPDIENIHTVTIYIRLSKQPEYYDYILSLNPSRIIFNPGTENPELVSIAKNKGIEIVENCTLVMLDHGLF
ncbi:MAG: CoA-binding protein [Bacteroidetes bacterium]|nr:CoA-binding protein [Bacteroidota bacterium]MBL6943656.1 CoA-binding protein [Bacteroidales bacterium]